MGLKNLEKKKKLKKTQKKTDTIRKQEIESTKHTTPPGGKIKIQIKFKKFKKI
jgi:hypothetical protein